MALKSHVKKIDAPSAVWANEGPMLVETSLKLALPCGPRANGEGGNFAL